MSRRLRSRAWRAVASRLAQDLGRVISCCVCLSADLRMTRDGVPIWPRFIW